MPRDRANLRTDIWGDGDWRALSYGAQWLYEYILTAPSLTYVGVADWRPTRVAKLARDLTVPNVDAFGVELQAARFVLIDVETEEVLVRSFLRHDGVLVNPNLWKSVGLSFTAVSSPMLRLSVAREAQRLRDENPDGYQSSKGGVVNPWDSKHLRTLLDTPSDTPYPNTPSHTPQETPSDTPSHTPSDTGSPTTTSTSTTTEASLPGDAKLKEIRLPKDWAPTAAHLEYARLRNLDVVAEADAFRLHAETHDRHAARWNAAFTTWLKKAQPTPGRQRQSVTLDQMRARRAEVEARIEAEERGRG
jgi:hypothetical protein